MEWPSTISNPEYPLEEEYEDTSITSKFEDGSVQARPKFTRSRDTYKLHWGGMPTSEYTVLKDFVKNQAKFSAVDFTWTHPESGETHDVRITKFSGKLTKLSYWEVDVELQEV